MILVQLCEDTCNKSASEEKMHKICIYVVHSGDELSIRLRSIFWSLLRRHTQMFPSHNRVRVHEIGLALEHVS